MDVPWTCRGRAVYMLCTAGRPGLACMHRWAIRSEAAHLAARGRPRPSPGDDPCSVSCSVPSRTRVSSLTIAMYAVNPRPPLSQPTNGHPQSCSGQDTGPRRPDLAGWQPLHGGHQDHRGGDRPAGQVPGCPPRPHRAGVRSLIALPAAHPLVCPPPTHCCARRPPIAVPAAHPPRCPPLPLCPPPTYHSARHPPIALCA